MLLASRSGGCFQRVKVSTVGGGVLRRRKQPPKGPAQTTCEVPVNVTLENVSPSLSGLVVYVLISHTSGWVRFAHFIIPWGALASPEIMRKILLFEECEPVVDDSYGQMQLDF